MSGNLLLKATRSSLSVNQIRSKWVLRRFVPPMRPQEANPFPPFGRTYYIPGVTLFAGLIFVGWYRPEMWLTWYWWEELRDTVIKANTPLKTED